MPSNFKEMNKFKFNNERDEKPSEREKLMSSGHNKGLNFYHNEEAESLSGDECEKTSTSSPLIKDNNVSEKNTTKRKVNLSFNSLEKSKQNILKRKKYNPDIYYKIENHFEIYELGSSFLLDYKKGDKVFSFITNDIVSELQKTIIGLGAFFNYHNDNSVTIITDTYDQSVYEKVLGRCDILVREFGGHKIEAFIHSGIEVIEFQQLLTLKSQLSSNEYDIIIKNILDELPIVMIELPPTSEISKSNSFFFPLIQNIDSISIVTKMKVGRRDLIQQSIEFFKKYQVNFKGLILS